MSERPSLQESNTRAIWLVLASICSVQLGAASAKTIFGHVTPTTAVWLRLASAALVMLAFTAVARARRRASLRSVHLASPRGDASSIARSEGAAAGTGSPSPTARPARNWGHGLLYAAALVTMNWSFYQAFSRIPVGLAVTLEFLGPLGVAVVASRRGRDLLWPALALVGVVLLGFTPTRLDPIGVAFALVAAICWAAYIVFSARAGRTWPGSEAITLGCTLGALALAAPAISQSGGALLHPHVLLVGGAVGLLSSVIPYTLEMQALRTLPPRVFGILMSIEPAVAALFAWLVLREGLHPTDLVAMACVIIASIGATRAG